MDPTRVVRIALENAVSVAGTSSRIAAMSFRLAADAVLLLHLAFILFAVLGAALAARWRWIPAVHLPAAAWGFFVEITGRFCPLTVLENYFRLKAGQAGYSESFLEHYLLNIIYPSGLTRGIQFTLAGVVLVANAALYGWLLLRRRHRAQLRGGGHR